MPISRLTLESTYRQIALRMDATCPFLANGRSDNSDLARSPKMTESLVRLGKIHLALAYLEATLDAQMLDLNSENRL